MGCFSHGRKRTRLQSLRIIYGISQGDQRVWIDENHSLYSKQFFFLMMSSQEDVLET